ncbi:MAG: hypothetical protein ACE141_05735 [Bryobacteraceae bacterium]
MTEEREEAPPFLGSWRRVYLAVLGWLAFLILLFFWFTREFTP